MNTASVRILVVDDYAPFREFVCSTLAKSADLHLVGEAADGQAAVQKAEELQPDLIVLDIGLPMLNGIEAARRIRTISPQSKILFVSQESSPDVVREALGSGALGYVVKTQAGRELLAAVRAVLDGEQFISGVLSRPDSAAAKDSHGIDRPYRAQALQRPDPETADTRSHKVEFYSDDAALVRGFADHIEAALQAGNAVIVASTGPHRKSLLERLHDHGLDMVTAIARGRYVALDADDILSTFMENDLPDPVRFFRVAGGLIAAALGTTTAQPARVLVCGECTSVLWAQGKADAAIQVEQLCNQLIQRYDIEILCGFSLRTFSREEDKEMFRMICRAH